MEAERFRFFEHNAGYATPPGRAVCALELARAERWLEGREDAEFIVEDEWDFLTATDEQVKRIEAGKTEYVMARLELGGTVRASLGGIEVRIGDPDDYLRVIAAELADETIADLERSIRGF